MFSEEGPHIGEYTPVRHLGESARAHTYLYRHELRKRYAVIKLPRTPLATSEEKETFLTHAKLLRKLVHRSIVAVQDYGLYPPVASDEHYGFLVMQYVESQTSQERFADGGLVRPDEIRRPLQELAEALQYASATHVAHGNLHPGNVLWTEKGVYLTDFALWPGAPGTVGSSFLYQAPEHLRGEAGPASDQYALAVMAYEWLCGRRPYAATTPEELRRQQESEQIPSPGSLNEQISPLLEAALMQALAPDPGARFARIQTFSDSYGRALMGLPPSTPRESAPSIVTLLPPASPSQSVPESGLTPIPPTARKARKSRARAAVVAVVEGEPSQTAEPKPVAQAAPATLTPVGVLESPSEGTRAEEAPATATMPAAERQPASVAIGTRPQPNVNHLPQQSSPERSFLTYGKPGDLQLRVESDLRQGGVLSLALQGYEERPAQIEMASLAAKSITEGIPLIIEAGTGTGKTLSYLLPIVRSGKVAIVSTANKALQEQLYFKDIPFIQKYIRNVPAALVKGMGNYICLDRVEQEKIGLQHHVRNPDFLRLVEIIQESNEHFTGDFEMLGFTLPQDIRSKVNADRDQCAWTKCSYYGDCYVHKMKLRAGQASVIVVNHTLLLLDALMEGKLLPERDVIIIDEAHHLEEEATRSFTTTVSPGRVHALLSQSMLKTHTSPTLQDETRATLLVAWERLRLVAEPGMKGRANLKEPFQEGLGLATMIDKLGEDLRKSRPKDLEEKDEQLYEKLISRAENLGADLRLVFSVNQQERYVYYVESTQVGRSGRDRQLEVSAAPLDVTSWLREQLFDQSNVICTSATLATIGPDPAHPEVKGPNFAYFRSRAGLDHQHYPAVQERILPLTFDYASHALLYLPRHIPEPAYGDSPAAKAYNKAIGDEMLRLVQVSQGRAFLLFSSKRMLDEVFEHFQRELPPTARYALLRQGDMARMELVRVFREREGAVLFGLKSFWEGVDIAGEALSLVVIDKLPFDPPDDPVHEARVNQMKAAGENWFGTYVLPQTVLRLKQGLGRLLRTHSDRGVMAILDTRLYTKAYGKQIVQALPPARRAFNLETVAQFFADEDEED